MMNSQINCRKSNLVKRLKGALAISFISVTFFCFVNPAQATDPPHDSGNSIECSSCHTFHNAPGGALTTVAGNSNLCQSCHVSGGSATNMAMAEADQAQPGLALPASMSASGTSHRWDATVNGRVSGVAGNTSTGTVKSESAYTGPNTQTYVMTVTRAGDAGVAEFEWERVLRETSAPVGATTETVRDEFNSISYSGNQGTQDWSAIWIEAENNGTVGGIFRVQSSYCSSSNCLQVRANSTSSSVNNIYRPADLTGATAATLSYSFNNRLNGDDGVVVEISANGGSSYSTLATYTSQATGSGSASFDISSSIASDTRVRFRINRVGDRQYIYFDNVQIEYTLPPVGGGSNTGPEGTAVTGALVPLGDGLEVTFETGTVSPSFILGDSWNLFVTADVANPADSEMLVRLEDGAVRCSTCHDQHSQQMTPFDPLAPAYAGSGTGDGRHFQRINNNAGQMCSDCHAARHVDSALMGSHPVGVAIPVSSDFQSPSSLPLDSSGKVVCLSCHLVHNSGTANGVLLRISDYPTLCSECHALAGAGASHFGTGNALLWPGAQYGSSFPAITDTSQTGSCANCHYPHGWPDSVDPAVDNPMLANEFEEWQCLTCHDGSPATADLLTEFQKASGHPLDLASGLHNVTETGLVNSAARHVECVDCHNSHEATASSGAPGPSTSPRAASGPLEGVQGINTSGTAVAVASYEYQVCFRCHADSTGKLAAPTTRQYPDGNVRTEFNGSAVSYHPVTTTGASSSVPSLINGWTTNSVMSCTNCHNNNSGPATGGSGPNGAHGSSWPSLLERRYDTADNTSYNVAKYDLCFNCHSSTSIMSESSSFGDHFKHIQEENTPCNVCHDPHASGNKRLINFDTSVVTPHSGNGLLEFNWSSPGNGSCTLRCHGQNHSNWSY